MQKKYFNRFDPFMPIKPVKNANENIVTDTRNEMVDDFNMINLNESFKFATSHIKDGFVIMISDKSIGTNNEIGGKLLEDFVFAL